MDKTVVFVLGADFSGTTMLDLILGSNAGAASIGELAAYVNPTSKRHVNPVCSCHGDCGLWLAKSHPIDPYDSLFGFHRISMLVDSSKQPGWVIAQIKNAKEKGYNVRFVLIWKSADEYSVSCANRGNPNGWAEKWIRYHRSIFQMKIPVYTVSLRNLLKDPENTLQLLCDFLGLNYTESMQDYAGFEHHIVFGSATARIELHGKSSAAWNYEKGTSDRSDFVGEVALAPKSPTNSQRQSINQIEKLLMQDGLKSDISITGRWDLNQTLLRRRVEVFLYRMKLDPGSVARMARKLR